MAMRNGIVCGIVFLANSLPSTVSTPVPPLPKPGPSYLKSNTIVCLPGLSALPNQSSRPHAAFPAEALQIEQVVDEDRLALEQVEAVAAEAAAQRHDHSLRAAFGNRHLGGDGVVLVQDARRIADGNAGILARVGENVRPAVALGRGVTRRGRTELSSGKTWYFAASVRNSACISLSLSGFLAARSLFCEKSSARL